jgi:formylglycine-generating enzyme required for sulfatase activity
VTPALELALAHAFRKKPENRTPTVDAFIEELTTAIHPGGFTTTMGARTLPVSSLTIRTRPPQSDVFVDNVAVGRTRESGDLLLEGIQSGNHHLRISRSGFQDWVADVVCDGKPIEVVAELREGEGQPTIITGQQAGQKTVVSLTPEMGGTQVDMAQTVQDYVPSRIDVSIGGQTTPGIVQEKKGGSRGLLLGIGGLLLVLIVGAAALAAAYMMGVFGGPKVGPGNATPGPTPVATPVPVTAELMAIPGGTFKMGRDNGLPLEGPANTVTVQPFKMDRTEVTNAEYYEFIKATGYRPLPGDWINDQPLPVTMKMPVRFVDIDDISAFAAWRSQRDGVTYRLPTEAEWEFAARNGPKQNLYPWGDTYDPKCAVLDKDGTEPEAVGTHSCPIDWGVVDLIGNVFEWTGTKAAVYPGSKVQIKESKEPHFMIRGGAALYKSSGQFAITSAFRADVEASKRDKELGFRLVTQ